jgi:hypothetical protein
VIAGLGPEEGTRADTWPGLVRQQFGNNMIRENTRLREPMNVLAVCADLRVFAAVVPLVLWPLVRSFSRMPGEHGYGRRALFVCHSQHHAFPANFQQNSHRTQQSKLQMA